MIIIGVDPGVTGAIAFLEEDGHLIEVIDTPTSKANSGSGKNQVSAGVLRKLLKEYQAQEEGHIKAYIEQVSAMPGNGVTSMFNFGKAYGVVLGLLAALEIPYEMVTPAKWKKHFRLTGREKDCARTLAQELWPVAPLDRKKDVGRADALLIARYGVLKTQRGE